MNCRELDCVERPSQVGLDSALLAAQGWGASWVGSQRVDCRCELRFDWGNEWSGRADLNCRELDCVERPSQAGLGSALLAAQGWGASWVGSQRVDCRCELRFDWGNEWSGRADLNCRELDCVERPSQAGLGSALLAAQGWGASWVGSQRLDCRCELRFDWGNEWSGRADLNCRELDCVERPSQAGLGSALLAAQGWGASWVGSQRVDCRCEQRFDWGNEWSGRADLNCRPLAPQVATTPDFGVFSPKTAAPQSSNPRF
jgi:hypothetical protein